MHCKAEPISGAPQIHCPELSAKIASVADHKSVHETVNGEVRAHEPQPLEKSEGFI